MHQFARAKIHITLDEEMRCRKFAEDVLPMAQGDYMHGGVFSEKQFLEKLYRIKICEIAAYKYLRSVDIILSPIDLQTYAQDSKSYDSAIRGCYLGIDLDFHVKSFSRQAKSVSEPSWVVKKDTIYLERPMKGDIVVLVEYLQDSVHHNVYGTIRCSDLKFRETRTKDLGKREIFLRDIVDRVKLIAT